LATASPTCDHCPVNLSGALEATELVKRVRSDPRKPDSMPAALRLVRNDLAHGTRGYDTLELSDVADLLDRVARAHLLRILGCPESAQRSALLLQQSRTSPAPLRHPLDRSIDGV